MKDPRRGHNQSRSSPLPSTIRRLRSAHLLHGGDDARIGAAAADVAAHRLAHVVVRRSPALVEQRDGGHDLTGGAVAALKSVVRDECLLHWMQLITVGQTFDRRYAMALLHYCKGQTGELASTVDMDGTRAALPVIAPFLGSREARVLPQRVEQCHPGLELKLEVVAVDVERHRARALAGGRLAERGEALCL